MDKPNLEQILNNIVFTSAEDCPTVGGFEKIVQKHMPRYDVAAFDMDEDHYTCPGDTIAATIQNRFVEDIQTIEHYIYEIEIKLYDALKGGDFNE